ncbi:hypothetical protein Tco_1160214 [Tanacetum coccineum]
MLAPRGGGLILYQAYALGWLLEEIHVTLAHLEKKKTRLQTYTKSYDDFCKQFAGDGVASIKRCRRDQSSNGVRIMAMASGRGRLKEDLESSTWRRHLEHKVTSSRR